MATPTHAEPASASPPGPERASEPGRGAGSSPPSGSKRAEILAAATAAFAARGFRGASLASIAAEVGMTQAGVLHHFPSKSHLLLAVLQQRESSDVEAVQAHLAEHPFLAAMLDLTERNAAREGIVRLFVTLQAESVDADQPGHEWFRARYRRLRALTADGVRAEQQAGRIVPGADPDQVATEILALLDGLQIQWLLDPDLVDMPTTLRHFLDRLAAPAPDVAPGT